MYRTHSFHTTESGCALVLQKDIMYWGVDELTMEPCCALKYYPEAEWCSRGLCMEATLMP